MKVVKEECRKHNIVCDDRKIFEYMHTFEDKQAGTQMSLFD
jgi:hypothetical protein